MTGPAPLSSPAMDAVFSLRGTVERMLAVEAALARAEAAVGVVPAAAADAIVAACRLDGLDLAAFERAAAAAATPVIPLVRMVGDRLEPPARGYLHHGATSQDVLDTAVVLQARDGIDLLLDTLRDAGDAFAEHAERHRDTPMAGRTLLQHAVPTTFGAKAAHWLAAIARHVTRLRTVRGELVVQLGGAAGTLAPLGDLAPQVVERFAAELSLAAPDLPWHTDRDRLGEVAAALGLLAGTLGKVATDVLLLTQTEVGELTDTSAGGSSTMPHKRNPVDATFAAAASRLALGSVGVVLGAAAQEHERGAGGWQAEWAALPDAFRWTAVAAERVAATARSIAPDPARMRANLELTGGQLLAEPLALALAPALGRDRAHELVAGLCERAARDGRHLAEVADADGTVRGALDAEEVERLLDPANYLGSAGAFADRAVAAWRELAG